VGRLRVPKTPRILLASGLAALMIVVMPGTQAHADPSVSDIEAQISTVWNQLEPLIEQYNGVHDQYMKNKAQQDDLASKLAPLQKQYELGQVRIGAMAAQVYMGGEANAFNAVVTSGSPKELAEKLSYLDQITRSQESQLAGVMSLKEQYDAQKKPVDDLVAQLAAQDADLVSKKKAIESRLNDLQKLRQQAYGTTGTTGSFRPWPCPATYAPTAGYRAAAWACSQAGKPYLWAAAGPNSYDCSGLVMAAWQTQGVYLPHNSQAQRSATVSVSRANLQLGDLVFYYATLHHVAIYVGDNKVMQAPSAGDYVRMTDMDKTGPINSYGRPS
jgi:cell wall-associated NlpC family hydrolase